MIPLRLQLRNFMCYGEGVAPLVLDGVHIACLSGDNGHGKSALLDALTWALWGRARAKTDDELVHMGKTEMEVELELAVAGQRYRLIRKRLLKGKRGTTTLEFQVHRDDGYHPITGDSVHETQRKISAALHMEYETFINSALLLQGRADEFTVKAPTERKKVLADVLGLAVYEDLEARAKESARGAEQARREMASAMAEFDREIDRRPEYQAERDRLSAALAEAEAKLAAEELVLRRALAAKQTLDAKSRQLDELRQRQEREQHHLAGLERQVNDDRSALRRQEAILAQRVEVEQGYQRLGAVRESHEDFGRKATRLLALTQRRAAVEQEIALARAKIEAEAAAHAATIKRAEQKRERCAAFTSDLALLQKQLDGLSALEEKRDALKEQVHAAQSQSESLRVKNEQLKKEMALLKEKLDILSGEGATCPVCETPLGPAGRQTLSDKYHAEGKQYGDEFREHQARLKELEEQLARALREVALIDKQLGEREGLRRRAGVLERSLAEIDESERERAEAEKALQQLRESSAGYGRTDADALVALDREIGLLGYDAAEHERLRKELATLAVYEAGYAALQTADTAANLLRSKLRENESLARSRRDASAELAVDFERVAREVAQSLSVLADLVQAQDAVDALGKSAAGLRTRLGGAEQLLGHCDYLAEQRKEKSALLQRAIEEKGVFDELALAFGKRGIQAMIIDGALPEIEDEANQLLARLTDNRMHVKLETQREAKSSDGVIETLDIKIADELGYRHYELYSGGEAFRVNFALRIALSKLLARRAGARLQTLIMDEGFGTQDASGRERLVEAITSVAADFDCILVITHIQELKDAFPVRIDVVKGADGSQIVTTG